VVSSTYWLYIWVTWWVSNKRLKLLTLHEHLSSPRFYGGVRVAHLFIFLCCAIMCLYVLSSVLWCPLRFPQKMMFGSFLPPVVWRGHDVRFVSTSSCLEGGHVLFTLFVFVCVLSCPTYIVLYFSSYWYPMLSVSFNCPFLIARSVFSNVYIVL
jgi:hypothetical protein